MEIQDEPSTLTDALMPTLVASINTLRERYRNLLRQQNERLRELESRLEQQFTSAEEVLAQASASSGVELERIESLEREVRRLQQLREQTEHALNEARVMLSEMEEERRVLQSRLDESLQRGTGSETAGPGDPEETERLHRRLELAMQEIRELKAQNEEMLERPARPAAPRPLEGGANFDWETQKRRFLEELESGFDKNKPADVKEKLRCEDVIRETSRIIAEKDREIAELRRQLEARPSVPTPAENERAAENSILDADAVIQTERARLAELQSEWEEKLRRAEVEVSIERAKIARERLQLEEKSRMFQSKPGADAGADKGDGKTSNRGRWLTRLGLGNDKDKDGG